MWLALIFVGAVAIVARWSSHPLCPLRSIRQRSTCQVRRLRAWDAWHHGLRNGFDMIWPTSTGVLQKLRYLGVDSASWGLFQPSINHHWRDFHFNKANTSGIFFDLTLCFMFLPHHSPWPSPWPWSSHPSFAGCGSAICCRSYMQWSNYSTNQPSTNRFYAIEVGLTDIHGYSWFYRYTVLYLLYPWNHHDHVNWKHKINHRIWWCRKWLRETQFNYDHVSCQPPGLHLGIQWSCTQPFQPHSRSISILRASLDSFACAGLEGKWTMMCVEREKDLYIWPILKI